MQKLVIIVREGFCEGSWKVYLNDDYLIWFDIELTHLCYHVKRTLLGNWIIGRQGERELMEKNVVIAAYR
jgi:hypothetical protein